jgi:G3E family GTPase
MAFNAFANKSWPGVIRAKGFFWLATRPNHVGELAQAGAMVRTSKRGLWWAAVPKTRWPDSADWRESMKPYFDRTFGDRRQEIVFIGLSDQMDEAAIRAELDGALTGMVDRFTPDAWKHLPDPFPNWDRQAA